MALSGHFSDEAILPVSPALDYVITVLGLPLLKCSMISTFVFYYFACVWILVSLQLARLTRSGSIN